MVGGRHGNERTGSFTLRSLADLHADTGPKGRGTPFDLEVAAVGRLAKAWLARCPGGVLPHGGDGATEAMEALADSWASTALHALAARPGSAAMVGESVEGADRVAIEPRLERMCMLGLLERRAGRRGEAVYAPTEWLREGIALLIAAARHERRHLASQTAPVCPADVVAAYRLSLSLIRLPEERFGACRLELELGGGVVSGVIAMIEEGRVVSAEPDLDGEVDASARGKLRDWFRAVIDGGHTSLVFEDDQGLARAVVEAMHETMFSDQP